MSATFPGSEYVGRVLGGQFMLLRRLGGTDHSSVFLTELAGDTPRQAALKLVAADDAHSTQWEAAKSLSHPDLIRVFAFGRTEPDGQKLDYILSEYADEVLAEILAERPLTPEETGEMLPAMLDALEYLHERGFVHGGLKPSNILAVGDRLKLSVDGLEAAGQHTRRSHRSSEYDAPEIAQAKMSPEMDVWSLGVVLVNVLTRQMPALDGAGSGDPVVPASVPEPFASIARDCLRMDPARRSTLAQVKLRLEREPSAAPASEAVPPAAPLAAPAPAPAGQMAGKRRANVPATIAALTAVFAGVVVAAVEMHSHRAQPLPEAAMQNSAPALPPERQPAPERPVRVGPAANAAVVHQVMPEVPEPAMATIQGHVRVAIRLEVDANGDVSSAAIETPGPSRYFAEFALNAARGWKFKPAGMDARAASSTWLLQFVFTQGGVEVTTEEMGP